ncbi:MAG: Rab family GTPase [Gloeobacterales cyanobacterium]
MIQKKICMVGASRVGKTSLISRFVRSIFSDIYHATIGVKIDKKSIIVGEQEVNLMLWDISEEEEFEKITSTYLQGAAGYILVVDGTRQETLNKAISLQAKVEGVLGPVPFILMINKSDLEEQWEVTPEMTNQLTERGWTVMQGSAKTGLGVEDAFQTLGKAMLA